MKRTNIPLSGDATSPVRDKSEHRSRKHLFNQFTLGLMAVALMAACHDPAVDSRLPIEHGGTPPSDSTQPSPVVRPRRSQELQRAPNLAIQPERSLVIL